jgi:hypothetical protein
MGTKNSPGTFDCYVNAEPDEPMFVLLARDEHAPELVLEWAGRREALGESPEKVAEARACADAMSRWWGTHCPRCHRVATHVHVDGIDSRAVCGDYPQCPKHGGKESGG